jgi:hypothetical protein
MQTGLQAETGILSKVASCSIIYFSVVWIVHRVSNVFL